MVIHHKLFDDLGKNSSFSPFSLQGGVHTIASTNRLSWNKGQGKQRVWNIDLDSWGVLAPVD